MTYLNNVALALGSIKFSLQQTPITASHNHIDNSHTTRSFRTIKALLCIINSTGTHYYAAGLEEVD